MTAWLLVAHGSRDPRSAGTIYALGAALRCAGPGAHIAVAFLSHTEPDVDQALTQLCQQGHRRIVVVPLLLTAAYHSEVELPALIANVAVRFPDHLVEQVPVLGPGPLLIAALERRIREAGVWPGDDQVGLVLAAAGSRSPLAMRDVAATATGLAGSGWAAVVAGYASAADPSVPQAVQSLRDQGVGRVVVASYLLAPGRFSDALRNAGADVVTDPLGDAPEVVRLVLARGREPAVRAGAADSLISA